MKKNLKPLLISWSLALLAGPLAIGCGKDDPTPAVKRDTGATPTPLPDAAAPADTAAPDVATSPDTTTAPRDARDAAAPVDAVRGEAGPSDAVAAARSAIPSLAEQMAYQPTYTVETLPIVKGHAAMEFIHSNQLVAVQTASGASRNFKMLPIPRVMGGGPSVYVKPSQYFSITSTSKNRKTAALFIDFFTNDIEANEILAAERGVPVANKVAAALKPKQGKAQLEVFDLLERVSKDARALPLPDPPRWSDILAMVYTPKVVVAVLGGMATPEEATALFRREANLILAGGMTPADAGAPPADAGAPPADAGAPPGDAGATADAARDEGAAADTTPAPDTASADTAAPVPSSDGPAGAITLNVAWWGSPDRHDRTTRVIALFKKKYPHINVYFQYASSTDYWPMMRAAAAAGTLPDVMQQDHAYIEEFYTKGHIIALDDLVADGSLDLSDVPKGLVDGGRVKGKLVGVNLGSNTQGIVLDADAFTRAGVTLPTDNWTWSDFDKACVAIHGKLGIWGYGVGLHSYTPWKALYLSAGGWVFSPDNTAIGYSDDGPWVEHLKMILRLQK